MKVGVESNSWADFVDGYTGGGNSFDRELGLESDPNVRIPGLRSAQQMAELAAKMAKEQRLRGPMAKGIPEVETKWWHPWGNVAEKEPWGSFQIPEVLVTQGPDPVDQVLRGSWYHGMSSAARAKVEPKPFYDFKNQLDWATERGFPESLHNVESISNKLGEPAGVSLSLLPQVSGSSFSPDSIIHRVMPLYGKAPLESTVNLMSPAGRALLNDAYDAVANRGIENIGRDPWKAGATFRDWLERGPGGGSGIELQQYDISNELMNQILQKAAEVGSGGRGEFNKGLSGELKDRGKRFVLYNPKRWDEYEMLALDPQYALPIDYRKWRDYNYLGAKGIGVSGKTDYATPAARKGLSELDMSGPKRLGDIYSERPWSERLTEPVKRYIMESVTASPDAKMQMEKWLSGKPLEVQSKGVGDFPAWATGKLKAPEPVDITGLGDILDDALMKHTQMVEALNSMTSGEKSDLLLLPKFQKFNSDWSAKKIVDEAHLYGISDELYQELKNYGFLH